MTTSGQVRVNIISPKFEANYLCVVKVEKPWGLRSWPRINYNKIDGCILIFINFYVNCL